MYNITYFITKQLLNPAVWLAGFIILLSLFSVVTILVNYEIDWKIVLLLLTQTGACFYMAWLLKGNNNDQ